MHKNWIRLAALTGTAIGLLESGQALAQLPYYSPYFYGRDYRYFQPYEMNLWRSGRWVHGWHEGRYGWWWDVGGVWYYYDQPMYPFPTYAPPAAAEAPPPAPAMPAGPPSAQAQIWYYCENPKGYYPYVQSCPTQWRQVPAAPGGAPPGKAAK